MEFPGLVLAAGGGVRLGRPKALVRDADGTPWVARAVHALRDGGCDACVVVLGASAEDARPLVPEHASVVVAADWREGLGASLRTGLRTLEALDPDASCVAAVVTHVDLPDVPAAVVRRLLRDAGPATIRQARYGSRPGHPVVLGRSHWAAVADRVRGDGGARDWMVEHGVQEVDCSDLFDGADIDTPEQLARHLGG